MKDPHACVDNNRSCYYSGSRPFSSNNTHVNWFQVRPTQVRETLFALVFFIMRPRVKVNHAMTPAMIHVLSFCRNHAMTPAMIHVLSCCRSHSPQSLDIFTLSRLLHVVQWALKGTFGCPGPPCVAVNTILSTATLAGFCTNFIVYKFIYTCKLLLPHCRIYLSWLYITIFAGHFLLYGFHTVVFTTNCWVCVTFCLLVSI